MKQYILIAIAGMLLLNVACHQQPELYVKGTEQPVISLSGNWEICLAPYKDIMSSTPDKIIWNDIKVPGECMMQGYAIKHDQPFTYKKDIVIPDDYNGKVIKINFEGVYSYAKVWIDNKYIGDHSGGFTAWECDISSSVQAGEKATLIVEVTDKADEISYASGYAKHQIGGILGDVSLLALPENYPELLTVHTDLDDRYQDAELSLTGATATTCVSCTVELELYNSEGRMIKLKSPSCSVSGTEFNIRNLIANPFKWDAEHPNLYSLKVSFRDNGRVTWYKYYQIGFREIEIEGNKFLVNGKQVKIRGLCRHEMDPLLGRVSTSEYELKDVLLAKEANVNFIRTSHYPPGENFLRLCDKYGIYVEDESAVCFVGSHRTAEYYPGSSENSPEFTNRYLSQLKEMVISHINHPSVIIWSIGNENTFGTNFKKSYDWVKAYDPSRPVIFSYPGHVPDSIKSYDILSMHYPGTDGNMEQYGIKTKSFGNDKMPVIFDEWAHVACYNSFTVKEDPNIRDFWGISLDSMWQKVYDADGGLGGAIWSMIDETFMLPAGLAGYNEWWGKIDKNVIPGQFTGHTIGYGEWGIADTWRRKKPEFWNVKRAYSPVRVLNTKNIEFIHGKNLEISVYNRYDFTNLSELKVKLTLDGESQILTPPDIPAHTKGSIPVVIKDWPEAKLLYLDFLDKDNNLVDSYALSRKTDPVPSDPIIHQGVIAVAEDEKEYSISCENNLKLRIDKSTGLFKAFETTSGKMFFSGPFINMRMLGKEVIYSSHTISDICNDWKLDSLSVEKKGNTIAVKIKGYYSQNKKTEFNMLVYPDGYLTSEYSVDELPDGNLREAGIRFIFENIFDTLQWKRKPYWSTYPPNHLSAPEGKIPLYTSYNRIYRMAPEKEWQYDKKSFFYSGIENETENELTYAAKGTKENIIEYTLSDNGKDIVTVYGDSTTSCRIYKSDDKIYLNINNEVDYPDLSWGNYTRNLKSDKRYSGKVQFAIR